MQSVMCCGSISIRNNGEVRIALAHRADNWRRGSSDTPMDGVGQKGNPRGGPPVPTGCTDTTLAKGIAVPNDTWCATVECAHAAGGALGTGALP